MPTRRFRPPWTIDEHPESFIVRDATGFALGYFYFDQENRRTITERMTKDEAGRWRSTSPSCRSCCRSSSGVGRASSSSSRRAL
jgi:hypothetical protein